MPSISSHSKLAWRVGAGVAFCAVVGSLIWVQSQPVSAQPERAARQHELIAYFGRKSRFLAPEANWLVSTSPIQGVIVPGNEAVRRVAGVVQAAGFEVRPIVSPTVAAGRERIRICLHSYNTEAEIDGLLGALAGALVRL